jgi:uncharacterized RDD family membrane protein YckC
MKYQTFGLRFLAGFIDGLVLMPLDFIDDWALSPERPMVLVIVWALIRFPTPWLYSVLMHGFYGQTIGKKLAGLKVLDVSERPISMRQAFLRDSVYIGLNIIGLCQFLYFKLVGEIPDTQMMNVVGYLVGYAAIGWFLLEILTTLTNKKRRALHDFIAGTVVVRTEYVSEPGEIESTTDSQEA